ncbi:MAG: mechanosensitive ion channel family protein [Bacteroidales bacterium]
MMDANLMEKLRDIIGKAGFPEPYPGVISAVIALIVIFFLAWLLDYITKRVLLFGITSYAKKSQSRWDDTLVETKFFRRLSHIAPAILIYYLVEIALAGYPDLIAVLKAVAQAYMVIIGALAVDSLSSSLHIIYQSMPISRNRSIKGYVQVFKIFIYFIAGIFILHIVFNKEVSYFLTGLGAVTAVLLLVFKDTILGLVGGVQLAAYDMVRIGDWIEMPSRNADGNVTDISLNTVKVQNWDKTITTIPTYALVSESFYNWRGMEESGGRRIKRSLNIDVKSIRFLDNELIDKLRKIQVLTEYIDTRLEDIKKYNKEHNIDESMPVNGRRLTNIGTFRKYVEEYLKRHPMIKTDMTFLVRHLQPTEKGLPLEIYVFCKDQRWAYYEAIQADIFDHLLAIIGAFDLKVFQNPSGDDFRALSTSMSQS